LELSYVQLGASKVLLDFLGVLEQC